MIDVVSEAEDAFAIRLVAWNIDGIGTVGDLIEAIRRHIDAGR